MSNISRTGNSTTQACAACKYQRRKCATDCVLAPYFPHNRQRQFLNAHKLFGVSNICKIIKNLNPPEKDEAMRTIIFQSDVRANDPVGGCFRMIRELQRQIEYNRAELDFVLHQLAIYRAQAAAQQQTQFIQAQAAAATAPDDHQIDHDCQNIIITDAFDIYDPVMQYHDQYPQSHQDQQEFVIHNPDNNRGHLQVQDPANANNPWTAAANVLDIPSLSISSSPNYLDDKVKRAYNGNDQCSTHDDHLKPILDVNDVNFEPDDPDQLVDMRSNIPLLQLVLTNALN